MNVVLQYEADITKIKAQLSDLEHKLGGVEETAKKSATGTESTFKKTGDNIHSHWGGLMTKVAGYVGAAFAAEKVIEFGKASLRAFEEAQNGEMKLLNALKGRTDVQERLLAQAKELQKRTIIQDDAIVAQQAFLAAQGRTEEQIKRTVTAAIQLSTVTGEDLNTSVMKLDATFEGNIGRLGKLDSRFKDLTQEQLANGAAIDLINEKYAGFAEAATETFSGRVEQLKNRINDAMEVIGGGIADVLGGFMDVGSFFLGGGWDQPIKDVNELEASTRKLNESMEQNPLFSTSLDKKSTEALNKIVEDFKQKITEIRRANPNLSDAQLPVVEKYKKRIEEIEALIAGRSTKGPDTLADLRTKLQGMQADLENLVPGSSEFIKKQKEINDLSEKIDKSLGKETETSKKLNEEKKKLEESNNKLIDSQKKLADEEVKFNDLREKEMDNTLHVQLNAQQTLAKNAAEEREKEIKFNEEREKEMIDFSNNQIDATKKEAAQRLQIYMELAHAIEGLINSIFDLQRAKRERDISEIEDKHQKELNSLNDQLGHKQISEKQFTTKKEEIDKKYAEKVREIKIKEAKADKEQRAFNIAIQTAENIVKAFPNPVLIALAAISGAVQLAAVSAQPLPKFKQGTLWVNRGSNPYGDDTIPAMLNEGEAVIPTHLNRKYKHVLEDIYFDRYERKMLEQNTGKSSDAEALLILAKTLRGNGFDERLAKNTGETNQLLKQFLRQNEFKVKRW